jgi:BirA family transcriptional regulator, biotin operon repressor / biotin---[acetyl-CoA-carboxylase] ligase
LFTDKGNIFFYKTAYKISFYASLLVFCMFVPLQNTMSNITRFGKVRYHFDCLASTNDFALYLLAKGTPPVGTLVTTANQTAGRGQYGRKWVSEPDRSLAASIIVYPDFLPSANIPFLSYAVALSIAATVSEFAANADVRIKWPNDIYIGEKKVAGILIENSILSTGKISSSVIGIGINIKQSAFGPEASNATSLLLATGQKYNVTDVLDVLCRRLDASYTMLENGDYEEILKRYNALLFGKNRLHAFEQIAENQVFTGEVMRADAQGQLYIREQNGSVRAWTHGSIALKFDKE